MPREGLVKWRTCLKGVGGKDHDINANGTGKVLSPIREFHFLAMLQGHVSERVQSVQKDIVQAQSLLESNQDLHITTTKGQVG